ncbi:MAG: hypothetical protein JSW00_09265 [Thermoplasmata archaeon]|nr:MAG: hypothetical protein JSW00_09265 [Thermoplasmata archaeon]
MRLRNLWICTVILLMTIAFFPSSQAAPKAVVYEMEVSALPAIQGKDLPIELKCEVGFGGACCYSVYAHDVEAEIILPDNITLIAGKQIQTVTSSGQSSGTVAVDPGGGLTRLSQTWIIKGEEYGEYTVSVHITGENELGEIIDETQTANITIASGASISSPVLPRSPSVNKDIIIIAEVFSTDSAVASVTLFYSKNQKNWVSVPMENIEGETWMGEIPGQKKEGEVYYYMESLDGEGETFTTEIYSVEVKDFDNIGTIKVLVTYGTLTAFILGIVLILYAEKRRKKSTSSTGLTILGASLRLSALRGLDEIEDDQNRLRKIRKWAALIIIIIVIILLVLAVATGQLQEVVDHTTNPTEA